MNKKIVFMATAAAVIAAIVIYTVLNAIFKKTDGNIAGNLTKSEVTVSINNVIVPSYTYNDTIYIIAENLKEYGIDVEYSKKEKTLSISSPNSYFVTSNDIETSLVSLNDDLAITYPDYTTLVEDKSVPAYKAGKYTVIPLMSISAYGAVNYNGEYYCTLGDFATPEPQDTADTTAAEPQASEQSDMIIVLDPGHGKSSSLMSDSEKEQYGWIYNENKGQWGEWRHFKSGTVWQDCRGDGCNHRVTPNGACWYPMVNSDRDTEPDINLQNALAARDKLEELGYSVRMTREANDENPSITRRLTYCYPDNDTSQSPDALMFVCIHSNAGGGSGTSYIALDGDYDQAGIPDNYVDAGNTLGRYINDEIALSTLLSSNPPITYEPELIAFCKSPVICGYLEIGFFDNSSDLQILKSSSDDIGAAIANGIDKYVHEYLGR